jgi:hypothetical protein
MRLNIIKPFAGTIGGLTMAKTRKTSVSFIPLCILKELLEEDQYMG